VALTPKREGDLTIEPARLEARAKVFQTEPIRVRVLPAGQSPRAGRAASPLPPSDRVPPDVDPFADVHPGQRDLLLRAAVDNDRPYVGQQITYSLYLLARANVSSIEKLQVPRLDGFWSEDIEAPQQLVPEQRILDGVPYTAYLLRKRPRTPAAEARRHPGRAHLRCHHHRQGVDRARPGERDPDRRAAPGSRADGRGGDPFPDDGDLRPRAEAVPDAADGSGRGAGGRGASRTAGGEPHRAEPARGRGRSSHPVAPGLGEAVGAALGGALVL